MLQVRGHHLYLNRSCTERISVKRSIGIHPTKKCAHWTTATHLHCLKDQIKAAPCAAYLSSQFLETAQLRSYKNWITCHLHICARTRGWGLVQQRKKKTWQDSFNLGRFISKEKMIPVLSKVHCILPLGCSERSNRQKKTLPPYNTEPLILT